MKIVAAHQKHILLSSTKISCFDFFSTLLIISLFFQIAAGAFVIREGDSGSHLYVSSEGEFEVIKDGKQVLGKLGIGKAFGELAILYNCKRTASIRALTNGEVWMIDRDVFQQV